VSPFAPTEAPAAVRGAIHDTPASLLSLSDEELGRRAHPYLVQVGLVDPPVFTVRHVVRPGQTMGHLAAR
jgi:hypothetical protein